MGGILQIIPSRISAHLAPWERRHRIVFINWIILWNGRKCLAQNSQEHVHCTHCNHKLFAPKMADECWLQNVSAKGLSYPNLVWYGREILNTLWAFILWSFEKGFILFFYRTGHKNVVHRHVMIPCGSLFHYFEI